MPDATSNILNQLGIKWNGKFEDLENWLEKNHQLSSPSPVFTKILD